MIKTLLQRLFRRGKSEPGQTEPEPAPRLSESHIRNRIADDFEADPGLSVVILIDTIWQHPTRLLPAITLHSAETLAEPRFWAWHECETVVDIDEYATLPDVELVRR